MAENQLVALSKQFAVDMIHLCDTMKTRNKATAIINQLLRSGTSIGANIHEANYASSKADFINKFQIALKECYETDYWLGVFHEAGIITKEEYKYIVLAMQQAQEIAHRFHHHSKEEQRAWSES